MYAKYKGREREDDSRPMGGLDLQWVLPWRGAVRSLEMGAAYWRMVRPWMWRSAAAGGDSAGLGFGSANLLHEGWGAADLQVERGCTELLRW